MRLLSGPFIAVAVDQAALQKHVLLLGDVHHDRSGGSTSATLNDGARVEADVLIALQLQLRDDKQTGAKRHSAVLIENSLNLGRAVTLTGGQNPNHFEPASAVATNASNAAASTWLSVHSVQGSNTWPPSSCST